MLLFAYLWEMFVNIAEPSLLWIFLNDKLTTNKRCSYIQKTLFIILISLVTSTLNLHHVSSHLSFLVVFLFALAFSALFYKDSISKKIIWTSIFFVICFFCDTIVALAPQCLFHINIVSAQVGSSIRFPLTLLYISSVASFVFAFHFINNTEVNLSWSQRIIYIFICLVGFFFGEYITSLVVEAATKINDAQFTKGLLYVSVIYMSLFLLLLIYFYKLAYLNTVTLNLKTKQQLLELESKEYSNLIFSTESLRQIKHELKLHLNTIYFMLDNEKYKETTAYVKKYLQVVDETHHFPATGNTAIDCILSTKIPAAKNKGIQVHSSIFIPSDFPLDELTTSALLGNLFNNALENCCTSNQANASFIDFSIKPVQKMLLIKIDNSYDGSCYMDNHGNYLSRKRCLKNRGLGLNRIFEIVEQHEGLIDISTTNKVFSVSIMIPLKEDTNEPSNT